MFIHLYTEIWHFSVSVTNKKSTQSREISKNTEWILTRHRFTVLESIADECKKRGQNEYDTKISPKNIKWSKQAQWECGRYTQSIILYLVLMQTGILHTNLATIKVNTKFSTLT